MKKLSLIVTKLALFCSPAIAYAFFCPSNFNQIDFGMTPDQVTQQCGKPDKQIESTKENDNIPQSWDYYIKQTVSMGTYPSPGTAEGTLKSSFAFDADGKLINISVNGIGVGATEICGPNLTLGVATRDTVKSACGDPAFVNKSQAPTTQKAIKVIEFDYTSSSTPATLIFEDGALTSKK